MGVVLLSRWSPLILKFGNVACGPEVVSSNHNVWLPFCDMSYHQYDVQDDSKEVIDLCSVSQFLLYWLQVPQEGTDGNLQQELLFFPQKADQCYP